MLDKQEISDLRQKLLERRRDIFEFRTMVNTSWQTLHEPETELEETASKETLSAGLAQLDDRQEDEIRAIDHALAKIDAGRYGKCEACHKSIASRRLRVMPWALYCVQCAGEREAFDRGGIESPAVKQNEESLTDEEIQEMIQDALQEDGRVDMEELDITCEDGVVYMNGFLPSDLQHEILLEIVQDTLDFDETVDNIVIDRQPWERRERTAKPSPEKSDKEIMMEGEDEEVDVYTSLSQGEPMTPPDGLVPEDRRSRE